MAHLHPPSTQANNWSVGPAALQIVSVWRVYIYSSRTTVLLDQVFMTYRGAAMQPVCSSFLTCVRNPTSLLQSLKNVLIQYTHYFIFSISYISLPLDHTVSFIYSIAMLLNTSSTILHRISFSRLILSACQGKIFLLIRPFSLARISDVHILLHDDWGGLPMFFLSIYSLTLL